MMEDYQQSRRHERPTSTNLLLVVALIGLSGVLAWQTFMRGAPASTNYTPRTVTPRGELESQEQLRTQVFKQTSPSVVFIRTKGLQRFGFGRAAEQELSSGTGFVWDKQGHIITNYHVVEQSRTASNANLEVQFADKSVFDADLIGGVLEHDIAILKVNAPADQLKPIQLGTSDDLQVGQDALAIGNPFGFDQTLSTGVIGGLNRIVAREGGRDTINGLIQTDAAINPGNSGGPLLDSSGRLIGVNTAIVSPTGAYAGLGFAVPVDNVVASVEMVLEESSGRQKPILGISVLDPTQVARWGLPDELNNRGLFIGQIFPNGPASQTGLEPTLQRGSRVILGDQITAVDGEPVTTIEKLHAILDKRQPGDVVKLSIWRLRDDATGEVNVTLQARKLIF